MITLTNKEIFKEGSHIHIAKTVISNNSRTYCHNHDFFEFFIIEQGKMTHFINNEQYEMSSGSLALVMPPDLHCFQKCRPVEKVIFTNVAFKKELFEEVFNDFMKALKINHFEFFRHEVPLSPDYLNIINSKINILTNPMMESPSLQRTITFKGLLFDILCLYIKDNKAGKPQLPGWLLHACEEMKKKDNYVLGLERFVELSGKTQEHLTRCMSKFLNTTPSAYINMLRLREASNLLSLTDRKVLDIIYEVGFVNISYFNEIFKRQFGVTAAAYRKISRNMINPEF